MQQDKLNVYQKRILLFSKIILTLLILTLLIFMSFLDLQQSRRNQKYLNLLTAVYNKGSDNYRFEGFELQRVQYLQGHPSLIGNQHLESRSALIHILETFGLNVDAETKGGANSVNRFVLMKRINRPPRFKIDYSDRGSPKSSVDSAMRFFNEQSMVDTVVLVTGFDSVSLKVGLAAKRKTKDLDIPSSNSFGQQVIRPSIPINSTAVTPQLSTKFESTNDYTQTHGFGGFDKDFKLGKIGFDARGLMVFISDGRDFRARPDQGTQPNEFPDTVFSKVSIDTLYFPSVLQFAGFDSLQVQNFANSKHLQQEVSRNYGSYDITRVDDMSVQQFEKSNSSVSVIGFDVSRKWFPLAMFLVLFAVHYLLYSTVISAVKCSLLVITSNESDDVLHFLVLKKSARFCIWVISPILTGFLCWYSSESSYPLMIDIVLFGFLLACIMLGIGAYRKSLKL